MIEPRYAGGGRRSAPRLEWWAYQRERPRLGSGPVLIPARVLRFRREEHAHEGGLLRAEWVSPRGVEGLRRRNAATRRGRGAGQARRLRGEPFRRQIAPRRDPQDRLTASTAPASSTR